MRLYLQTIVSLIALRCLVGADISSGWGSRVQDLDDSADEAHDAEILRAVITSMEKWQRKHNRTRIKRSQPNSVCYDELGCFEDSGPFGYLEMLPSPPQEINTRFLLYSTKSRGDIPLLDVPFNNMSTTWLWADRAFNSSIPTKVIVHGFGSNCDHIWVYEMRSALMAVEECNVICVDWEDGAVIPNYVRAAANTRLVGKQLAMLLEGLSNHITLKFEDVHLIGFSLGAHVAGFAGSALKNISRITGLDPAGPLFEAQDPRVRLDSTDAKFVDVIHSNGENLILGGLGSWQPMGHVDFYPNGGRMQTGCSNLFVGAVTDIIWSSNAEARSLCNHRRAYKFFTDSVSPKCHFPSFPCGSYDEFIAGRCFGCGNDKKCGNMGYYADRSAGRGQLYLLTRDEEPFCAHQYHVNVESSRNNKSLTSYGKISLALVGDSGLNETFLMTKKDDSELILGSTISRMLVPHPALGIPVKVQLLYQAYSGWISSGLSQWTIDKVILSDSFGKISSICKKGLILNSGVPIVLTLHPGNCDLSSEDKDDIKNTTVEGNDGDNKVTNELSYSSKPFIPTQVVRIGDELIKNPNHNIDNIGSPSVKREDILRPNDKTLFHKTIRVKSDHKQKKDDNSKPNIIPMGKHFRINPENNTSDPLLSIFDAGDLLTSPWQSLSANSLDNSPNERESGRAFGSINTQLHSFSFFDSKSNQNRSETFSEIVEPILKTPSTKNARSHDISKIKTEITEPILSSTRLRDRIQPSDEASSQVKTNRTPKIFEDPIERSINTNESKWVPSYNLSPPEVKATTAWDYINNMSKNTIKDNDREESVSHIEYYTTTQKSETFSIFQWSNKNKKEPNAEQNNNNSISSFTVQFLPSRLVSFLEEAEKYARNTLLPLVSAYTPRFLFFGQNNENTDKQEKTEKEEQKYVPLEERLLNEDKPVPKQTQQEKIALVKDIQPPNEINDQVNDTIENDRNTAITTSQDEVTHNQVLTRKLDDFSNSPDDPIKIVKAPSIVVHSTLAPVTLKPVHNSAEKVIIVYPSNTRDDRKIRSHSYPEIMQFESLYQQTLNQNPVAQESQINIKVDPSQQYKMRNINQGVYINLPTYKPPTNTERSYQKSYSTSPNFIPVSFPSSAA